ncbi:diguanylate cyclase [Microvirga sp. W0021]|uniref:diguanylate cyclase n=1 Tax=Hohaiivirga grylli TaxID=3133970 RepID=A0ABV0BK70_9HYPH
MLYNRSLQRTVDFLQSFNTIETSGKEKKAILLNMAPTTHGLEEILIFDKDGNLTSRSSGFPSRNLSSANCPYFQYLRVEATDKPQIATFCPTMAAEEDPSISIARRVSAPDGSFAGVAVAKISLSYIYDSFKDLTLGDKSHIFLVKDNGILLIRFPDNNFFGYDFSRTAIYHKIASSDQGSFVERTSLDRVENLYTYRHLKNVPLILGVSIAKKEILYAWYRRIFITAAVNTLVCLALLATAIIIRREIIRRETVETKLEKLSVTDGLTGLYNRRYFNKEIENEWRRALRSKAPLSMLMIDADNFKDLNDKFGHLMGDDVLTKIGEAISYCARRAGDLAIRYGGDEFAVLLPNSDSEKARIVADKIEKRLATLCHDLNKRLQQDNNSVSISIGIGSLIPSDQETTHDLIAMADEDLYRVKRNRKSRSLESIDAEQNLPFQGA